LSDRLLRREELSVYEKRIFKKYYDISKVLKNEG